MARRVDWLSRLADDQKQAWASECIDAGHVIYQYIRQNQMFIDFLESVSVYCKTCDKPLCVWQDEAVYYVNFDCWETGHG